MSKSGSLAPYAAGLGIGALDCLSLATARRPIGVTSAFESSAAALGQELLPDASGVNVYLAKREETPSLDWEWMLDAGVVLGSYLSARANHNFGRADTVPRLWKRRFGPSPTRRYAGAFVGGALLMFGARMAKGCTSGHAISGNMQLAASSFLFTLVMGATAVGVTRALFGGVR